MQSLAWGPGHDAPIEQWIIWEGYLNLMIVPNSKSASQIPRPTYRCAVDFVLCPLCGHTTDNRHHGLQPYRRSSKSPVYAPRQLDTIFLPKLLVVAREVFL